MKEKNIWNFLNKKWMGKKFSNQNINLYCVTVLFFLCLEVEIFSLSLISSFAKVFCFCCCFIYALSWISIYSLRMKNYVSAFNKRKCFSTISSSYIYLHHINIIRKWEKFISVPSFIDADKSSVKTQIQNNNNNGKKMWY